VEGWKWEARAEEMDGGMEGWVGWEGRMGPRTVGVTHAVDPVNHEDHTALWRSRGKKGVA
jgi:hypothetical protein